MEAGSPDVQFAIASGVFYVWGFVTVKLSFVALYHSIFVQKPLKRLNKMLGLVLVCQGIEESLVLIFQCRPVDKAWTPHTVGWCVNLKAFYYASVRGPSGECTPALLIKDCRSSASSSSPMQCCFYNLFGPSGAST